MGYSIFYLILYFLKLFEHSKYMIIYKIGNYGILVGKFATKFGKLYNFANLMIFEVVKFGKFMEFFTLEIFGIILIRIFKIEYFLNFPN